MDCMHYRCQWYQEQEQMLTDGDIHRSIAAATAAAAHSSRIAYATRPLGVRCRPKASTPTQCPKAYGVELHTTWWNAASVESGTAES